MSANNLYVGNLPYETTADDLKNLFTQAGTVVSAKIASDRETGRSRGFGFVEMESEEAANAAIRSFNGYQLGRRALRVDAARPREERPRGGGGGDRRERGGYGSRY